MQLGLLLEKLISMNSLSQLNSLVLLRLSQLEPAVALCKYFVVSRKSSCFMIEA